MVVICKAKDKGMRIWLCVLSPALAKNLESVKGKSQLLTDRSILDLDYLDARK